MPSPNRFARSRRTFLQGATTALAGCLRSVPGIGSGLTISVPQTARVDEPSEIVIENADPQSEVSLTATATDANGWSWMSEAVFEADEDGQVVVDTTAPESGTWTTADPYGIFWSKTRETTDQPNPPFIPDDVEAYDVELTVSQDDGTDETTEVIQRRLFDADIERERIDDGRVQGVFCRPAGETSGLGIVVLHGSRPGPQVALAGLLASHGHPALGLQYFGEPEPLPDEMIEIPLEIVFEAVEWLTAQPIMSHDSVGLWGVSRGGELALLVGAHHDAVGPVVSINGSGLVVSGEIYREVPAWTHDGDPLPFVPFADPLTADSEHLAPAVSASLESLDDERINAATIPVERIDGPVLLVSGSDDRLWPSVTLGGISAERLAAHDRPHEHAVYENAGHWIGHPPALPTTHYDPRNGWELGGTPQANAHAELDSWERTRVLFNQR